MLLKVGTCSDCGHDRYIVNKKYQMCQLCNHSRLHGEDAIEKKIAKQRDLLKTKVSTATQIKRKKINVKSKKQRDEDVEYAVVCQTMDDTYSRMCTGCGGGHTLSHSHIIPRSRRKDLVAVLDNLTYHCIVGQDGGIGCHQKWESTTERIFLLDYQKNMEYILKVDPEYYWLIFYKEKELGLR